MDFGSAWIDRDRRSWWVMFGSVSCVGRGSSGGFGVVGQVMGLDKWIGVAWIRWWHGFGLIVVGGFGSWRLVGFSVDLASMVKFFFFWLSLMVALMVGFWLGLN